LEPERMDLLLPEIRRWPGVDAGWKEALLESVRNERVRSAPPAEVGRLALAVDVRPEESLSLFLFHRQPWPLRWPVVPLCGGEAGRGLPSAWSLGPPSSLEIGLPSTPERSVRWQILLNP